MSDTETPRPVRAQCPTPRPGPDLVFGHDNAWGLGFGIDDDGFGMGRLGGSFAAASRRGGYAFAFLTGTLGVERAGAALDVFRSCLGLPPIEG